jgi:hypothetical protein
MSGLLSSTQLISIRALKTAYLSDVATITEPGTATADGFGGQTLASPTTTTTTGTLAPLGQTPQELAIASRAAGDHVVAVFLPALTTITNQATITIGATTIQVLGWLTWGPHETIRKVVGKVIT